MSLVLVTGASGNVGREVMRACLAAGLRVRAADLVEPPRRDGVAERSTSVAANSAADLTARTQGTASFAGPGITDRSTSLTPDTAAELTAPRQGAASLARPRITDRSTSVAADTAADLTERTHVTSSFVRPGNTDRSTPLAPDTAADLTAPTKGAASLARPGITERSTTVAAYTAADLTAPTQGTASFVRLDFTDRSTWSEALAGCDFVFLLRPPPLGDMPTALNPFVDAAFASGVKHVVFLSDSGAESKSWVPHRKVEDHLATTRGSWTVLRPGFFAQNLGDAYRLDLVEDDRFYVPAGQGRVAFLDVVDVGDVTARVFAEPERFRGKALRLAGPEAVTFGQLAERVSSVVGRRITYVPASIVGYLWHLWRKRRLPLMQVIVQTVLHVGLRSGEAEVVDDVQTELLGRPASPLEGYLARTRERWVRRA